MAIAKFFALQAYAKTSGKVSHFPLEHNSREAIFLVNIVVSYEVCDPFEFA